MNRPHSAGGIYGVFNDLHRSVRFLPQNVWACTIPGPKEPSLEQLNHILAPLKDDLMSLYTGFGFIFMRIYAALIGSPLLQECE